MSSLDSDTFAALYHDHRGWLRGWLYKRLECAELAADLAQDTFVRLLSSSSPKQFDSVAGARAWLRATAKNLCITLWRRQEIERAWLETLEARPEQYAPSAERQAIVLQALQEISDLLHRLPARTARAFMLAHVCQMTDAAVARELGISARMVRKHVARAMLACLKLNAQHTAQALRHDEAG